MAAAPAQVPAATHSEVVQAATATAAMVEAVAFPQNMQTVVV
jgi:hypothetical protein